MEEKIMLKSDGIDTKKARLKVEFAQDFNLDVDEAMAEMLGWEKVYYGDDGRPWKIVGIIEYEYSVALIFEKKKKAAKNFFLRVRRTQDLTEYQLRKFADWFYGPRVEKMEQIANNLLILDRYDCPEDKYKERINKVFDQLSFLV